MKKNNILIVSVFLLGIAFSSTKDRIITIGGCVTETVFELGIGNLVVAVDQSSTSPIDVKELPQVGYIRAISTEGILSMNPNMILTTTDIGPKKVVDQIKDTGVNLKIFKSPHTFDEILNLIDEIANTLNLNDNGQKIKNQMHAVKNKIDKIKSSKKDVPKVAFFMNPTSNSYNAAGLNTRANYLIEFLGGLNIFKDNFSRYKKVTTEEIINANPDIILVGSIKDDFNLVESVFLNNPIFKNLSAVNNKKIIYLDMGKHLTFGPKFVENALFLIKEINFEDT